MNAQFPSFGSLCVTFSKLSLALLLAACGGGGGGTAEPAQPPTTVSVTCPNGSSKTAATLDLANAACPAPLLLSMSPPNADSAVSPDTFIGVAVVTDSLLDPTTLTATLKAGNTALSGSSSILSDKKGFKFDLAPSIKLSYNQSYAFSATAKDALGRTLVVNGVFTTIPHIACAAPEVWDGSACTAPLSLPISPSVAAGEQHTVALKADGTLWAWGDNDKGQLGDGTTTARTNPVLITGNVSTMATGFGHTLAVKLDGSLWAWGLNSNGQLGDGSNINRSSPVRIGSGFVAVTVNGAHSLALKANGTLWAWGNNNSGQLGDGTTTERTIPVQIGSNFSSVATSPTSTVAVKVDGSLWAWGRNEIGQLGDGTTTTRTAPVQIGTGYRGVATAPSTPSSTFAFKVDGSLWAWGNNGFGQLGDGTRTDRSSPVSITGNYSAVAVGGAHTLGLKADGSLWAWGLDSSGQLGHGSATNTVANFTPAQIGIGYKLIAAGGAHSVAVKTDGSIWTWGDNTYGQLGNGSIGFQLVPKQIGTGFNAISANNRYTAGLKPDGSVWAWGSYPPYPVGGYSSDYNTPHQIDSGYSAVSAGWYRLFIRGLGGSWYTYGYPVDLIGSYSAVAEGNGFTVAVKADGSLWSWGSNSGGQLGDGTTIDRATPVQIGSGFSTVAAGIWHAVALKADGSLWIWGSGLAVGIYEELPAPCGCLTTPTLVGNGFSSVATKHHNTMALKPDGSLWAWGNNQEGQLGDGTTNYRRNPVQIGGGFSAISLGEFHTLGLKADGTLWTWGMNNRGQLGNGTFGARSTTPVLIDSGYQAVAAGDNHSVALKADGSLWAWGYDAGGGTLHYQATPGQVTGLSLGLP